MIRHEETLGMAQYRTQNEHRMRSVILALALCLAACSKDAQVVDPKLEDQFAACAHAFSEAAALGPKAATRILPVVCDAACPMPPEPTQDQIAEAAIACGLYCSEQARERAFRAPPSERLRALVEECGAAYYGLPVDATAVFDRDWFLIERLGRWWAEATKRVAGDKAKALTDAAQAVRFRVSLRVAIPETIGLPTVEYGDDCDADVLLLVGAEGVRKVARPYAMWAADGTLSLHTPEVAPDARPAVVVADEETPAARVLAAVSALGGDSISIAVRNVGGAIQQSQVALHAREPGANGRIDVVATGSGVFVRSDEAPIVGPLTDAEAIDAALAGRHAGEGAVEVVVFADPSANVRQLVRALDGIHDDLRRRRADRSVAIGRWEDLRGIQLMPRSLDKTAIRQLIGTRLARVRACYEDALGANPQLTGTVVAELALDASGHVTEASASGLGHEGVERCVADALRSLEFPAPPTGATRIRYPFTLRPAE